MNSVADMTEQEIMAALVAANAVLDGHFVLTSGRHSGRYVQCARILEDPDLTVRLAKAAAHRLGDVEVDLVAAPAVGGILFGFALAHALGVKFIFSERDAGSMVLRRGFTVPAGSRVIVAEDVVTTGGSVAEVVELVRAAGATVPAAVSIIDRGGDKAFDVPLISLLRLEVESWEPDSCVLCADGVPVHSPGSRRLSR